MEVSTPPTATLYINNINEKIRGEKLKRGLRQVFTPHGKVHRIYTRKSFKLRGQAFVIYEKLEDAAKALEKAQGFSFYGKPLRVDYARTPSDHTVKQNGETPQRRPAHPTKGMVAVKLEKMSVSGGRAPIATPAAQPFAPSAGYPYGLPPPPPPMQMQQQQPNGAGGLAPPPPPGPPVPLAPPAPTILPPALPHKVLFVESLPAEATEGMLQTLFAQYPGFQGVRMVPNRGCAFVDFVGEPEATVALQGLKDFKLTETDLMKLSYARQ